MLEVKVMMAGSKLIQAVIGRDMDIGISQGQVCIPDIRCVHGEAQELMRPWYYSALDHVAGACGKILIPHDPMVGQYVLADDQIGDAGRGTDARQSEQPVSCSARDAQPCPPRKKSCAKK